jgi:hypothetical protein
MKIDAAKEWYESKSVQVRTSARDVMIVMYKGSESLKDLLTKGLKAAQVTSLTEEFKKIAASDMNGSSEPLRRARGHEASKPGASSGLNLDDVYPR